MAGNKTFEVISPIDGLPMLTRKIPTEAEINVTLDDAKKAEEKWRDTPLNQRIDICNKAINYLIDKAQDIGEEITRQMGRPIRYSPFEIKKGLQERAKYMMEIAPSALEEIMVSDDLIFKRYIKKLPIGTILVLAPWNYPFLTSVNAIIPALVAGNCVILKHSFQTPLCAERFDEAFKHAGLPEGVFQYVHADHNQIAFMIDNPIIKYVAFTGSVEGGYAIKKATSKRFIYAGLELGGKDSAYVREDAALDNAIENLVDGSYFNSGQSCCGIERIYVHKNRYQQFVDGFVDLTRKYILDNPLNDKTTLGPMVRESSAISLNSLVKETVNQGAKALISTKDFKPFSGRGAYFPPQVLVDVNHNMVFMQEESFGPVVGIMSVEDDKEAIHLMNDSKYGLTASIWTDDIKAAQIIGDQVDTGTLFMNRCDYLDPALAWTGVKDSGIGCSLSSLGFEALTRPKSFHLKRE
jgi:acyl-CoA reductase-like NAD-dependent aldehyde dehydrogenase